MPAAVCMQSNAQSVNGCAQLRIAAVKARTPLFRPQGNGQVEGLMGKQHTRSLRLELSVLEVFLVGAV